MVVIVQGESAARWLLCVASVASDTQAVGRHRKWNRFDGTQRGNERMPNPQYDAAPIHVNLKVGQTLYVHGIPIVLASVDRGRGCLAVYAGPNCELVPDKLAIRKRIG